MVSNPVYQYIADNNTPMAQNVMAAYGFSVSASGATTADVATALNTIVEENGQQGLTDVMSIHPHKEVILELFSPGACCNSMGGCNPIKKPMTANCMGGGDKGIFSHKNMPEILLGVGVIIALALITRN